MVHAAQRDVRFGDGVKEPDLPVLHREAAGRELTIHHFSPVPANLPVLMRIRIGLDARWKHPRISATNPHSPVPRVEPPLAENMLVRLMDRTLFCPSREKPSG
jgi:hypothetical protein